MAATQNNGRVSFKTSKPNRPTPRTTKRERQLRKGVAGALGLVAIFGLVTSLSHMSDAIHEAWGSDTSIKLAWAMAIMIDAGMISSELGELVSPHKSKSKAWLRGYMFAAVVLSSMLNCVGVLLHSSGPNRWVGVILGLLLPWLLLALLRGAANLWLE